MIAQDVGVRPNGGPAGGPAHGGPVALRAVGLSKQYGSGEAAVIALDNVTLDIASGQFTAIMGPSGSGKSTLMHCLAGLDSPSRGDAFLGDTKLSSLDDTQLTLLRRERIGFVFQSFNLLPAFTARQNIMLPLELAGVRPDEQWFDMLVSTLGIQDRLSHRPAELSGGQQKRVAIARALMTRPDVIFADEPTGNLDSRSSEQVLRFLQRSVRELGQTIVMVTHDPIAASFADRVVVLADGKLARDIHAPTTETVLDALRTLGD
ncbi:MAG: ABC transporter ATP-binding protein [Chloroflexota bacterium]|nr:ABC transporter ATP-binding protein [Chloroflexota bacterium]